MICNQCKNEGVENQALGKTFYYCRTCKIEIFLEPVVRTDAQEEVDKLFDEWFKNIPQTMDFSIPPPDVFLSASGDSKPLPQPGMSNETILTNGTSSIMFTPAPEGYVYTFSGPRLATREDLDYCEGGPKTNLCDCMECQESYD
jgi:hypothetical protein